MNSYDSDDELMPPTLSNRSTATTATAVQTVTALSKGEKESPSSLSSFARPYGINNVLRHFLTVVCKATIGDTIPRTEATTIMNQYIIANNLRDPADKRIILYQNDPELSKLIKLPKDCPLTYFNLQSAIKHLFIQI